MLRTTPAENNCQETPDILAAALSYASQGFYIVPIRAEDKAPWLKAWQEKCTTETSVIAKWWHRTPKSNVGIVASKSALVVLDVDPKNGGMDSYKSLLAQVPEIKTAPTVITGSKGLHLYFKQPPSGTIGDLLGRLPGIDVKGKGCVVAPPSLHQSGARYSWLRDLSFPMRPFPNGLLEILERAGKDKPSKAIRKNIDLASEIIPDGSRNAVLLSYAGSLRHLGFTPAISFTMLKTIRDRHCESPGTIPDSELQAIVQSAWSYPPRVDLYRYGKWWRTLDLSGSEILFLLNVALDQGMHPSMRRLINTTGLTEGTIYKARHSLEFKNVISVVPGQMLPVRKAAQITLVEPPCTPKISDINKTSGSKKIDRSFLSEEKKNHSEGSPFGRAAVVENEPKATVTDMFSRPRKRRGNGRKPRAPSALTVNSLKPASAAK